MTDTHSPTHHEVRFPGGAGDLLVGTLGFRPPARCKPPLCSPTASPAVVSRHARG